MITDREPAASTYLGLFFVALATVMYEIVLTRIFSVTMWYHFAFVAISVAMFGMTVGAICVYLRPRFFTQERVAEHLTLGAVLFGVIGILILWRPLVTAEILTLLMGAFFLVAGLFQLITPFVISLPDWGWHTLNGLITLLLGILVLAQWPVSGLWVIGLFVGIELVFYGIAWIALALDLHSLA